MTSPGILRRVLGSDPELWQSAEAWMVVADLCEAEGYADRAERVRGTVATYRALGSTPSLRQIATAWDEPGESRISVLDTDGWRAAPFVWRDGVTVEWWPPVSPPPLTSNERQQHA